MDVLPVPNRGGRRAVRRHPRSRCLRCPVCGREQACSAADVVRFVQLGWPRCCRRVMAYFVEGRRDGPDDLESYPVPS